MLRSLVTCRNIALRCRPACSFVSSTKRCSDRDDRRGSDRDDRRGTDRDDQRDNRQRQRSRSSKNNDWKGFAPTIAPLIGLSWLLTIKDMLGIERFKTDDDPLKDNVKKAFISRKYGRYQEAVSILEEALTIAKKRGEELPISRVYDELANTYYEMGKLDDAERLFRLLIRRMIELHDKHENDPEFIGVSLKLADIFAQKGEIENAEIGYRHCVTKQMK
uniref:Tetratricopeptide repeat protein n=1 Tax=Parascaris univalens TaxID=6257 RepID=A0A914ZNC9_PARUN